MRQDKPVIGITKPDKENKFAFLCIWLAVLMAGGRPLKISPGQEHAETADIDGLILGGGKDIFPGRYNAPPKDDYTYDKKRDEMEVFWAERAKEEGIPTLGICRGAQLINVICGGTLHMDVGQAYDNADYPEGIVHYVLYRKKIEILDNTLLCDIWQTDEKYVNSLHKQAIDEVGDEIKIDAAEKNGVIQAISIPDHPFFLGVQFHPEFILHRKDMRQLFRALINEAANHRGRATA
jgi:putative glutamine amidotransferase